MFGGHALWTGHARGIETQATDAEKAQSVVRAVCVCVMVGCVGNAACDLLPVVDDVAHSHVEVSRVPLLSVFASVT